MSARSKPSLPSAFCKEKISVQGGREVIGRYLRTLGSRTRLEQALSGPDLCGNYGAFRTVRALIAMDGGR